MLSTGRLNYHNLPSDFLWSGGQLAISFRKVSLKITTFSHLPPGSGHHPSLLCSCPSNPFPGLELAASELQVLCKVFARLDTAGHLIDGFKCQCAEKWHICCLKYVDHDYCRISIWLLGCLDHLYICLHYLFLGSVCLLILRKSPPHEEDYKGFRFILSISKGARMRPVPWI